MRSKLLAGMLGIVFFLLFGCADSSNNAIPPVPGSDFSPVSTPAPLPSASSTSTPTITSTISTSPEYVSGRQSSAETIKIPSVLLPVEQKPDPRKQFYTCQALFSMPMDADGFSIGAADMYGANEEFLLHSRSVLFWHKAQPEPGKWDEEYLSNFEKELREECGRGRRILVVIVGTPSWASDNGESDGVPMGANLPIDDRRNIFARSLRVMVGRFSYLVKNWIVWNEPDVDRGQYKTWTGTKGDLVLLLKTAYLTIKSEDSSASVHLPALTHWWSKSYFKELMYLLWTEPEAKLHNYFFDYASLNLQGAVELYWEVASDWKKIMESYGIDKPIWITEANLVSVSSIFSLSEEEQSSWLIQASALSAASGVERFTLFRWGKYPPPDFDGVFDVWNKKAAQAARTAGRFFNGATSAEFIKTGKVWKVGMKRGSEIITVVWNMSRGASSYTIQPIPGATTLVFDKYGNLIDNVVRKKVVTLDAATVSLLFNIWVGGSPIIIVQTPLLEE